MLKAKETALKLLHVVNLQSLLLASFVYPMF